jgi:hypothetical protein
MSADAAWSAPGPTALRLGSACCVVAGFWVVVQLFDLLDFGHGIARALLLLVLSIACLCLLRFHRVAHRRLPANATATARRTETEARRLPPIYVTAVIYLICCGLIFVRINIFFHFIDSSHLNDIARATQAAVIAVIGGHNPYDVPIDVNPAYPDYEGYKYTPAMIFIYMPLTLWLGSLGLRLTNLILDAATVILIGYIGWRAFGRIQGVLAAVLYLMLPLIWDNLYREVVTDLAATVPLLAALAAYRTRPGIAGLMIGLSVSAKLLPGLLVLVCCLPPAQRSRYGLAILLGLLPAFAFLLLAPADFLHNIVWFPASRPTDSTTWLHGMSPLVALAARFVFVALFGAVLVIVTRRLADLFERCALCALSILTMLLTGPTIHNNYMIWWIPFFCLMLSWLLGRILRLAPAAASAAGGLPQ